LAASPQTSIFSAFRRLGHAATVSNSQAKLASLEKHRRAQLLPQRRPTSFLSFVVPPTVSARQLFLPPPLILHPTRRVHRLLMLTTQSNTYQFLGT
jgi:hypothetical protein